MPDKIDKFSASKEVQNDTMSRDCLKERSHSPIQTPTSMTVIKSQCRIKFYFQIDYLKKNNKTHITNIIQFYNFDMRYRISKYILYYTRKSRQDLINKGR